MIDRPQIADAQRIVVKIGSSSLTGSRGLNVEHMQSLVASLAELRVINAEVRQQLERRSA